MIENALAPIGLAAVQGAAMLALAPLLRGLIKKMKAALQMRQGPPLLQVYYDLAKLLRKEAVRSATSSWLYVAGPRRPPAACWPSWGFSRSDAFSWRRPPSIPAARSEGWGRAAK